MDEHEADVVGRLLALPGMAGALLEKSSLTMTYDYGRAGHLSAIEVQEALHRGGGARVRELIQSPRSREERTLHMRSSDVEGSVDLALRSSALALWCCGAPLRQ